MTSPLYEPSSDPTPRRRETVVDECHVFEVPYLGDERGGLVAYEGIRQVPFEIARVYFIYDVPAGAVRGDHAHRRLQQAFVAVSGSVQITLEDADKKIRYRLNRPDRGLFVRSGVWLRVEDFSPGAVCMVFASRAFEEKDCIRSKEEYLRGDW